MALGMINQKTTAVRVIPAIGKDVGDQVEFGGLLGYAPIMPVNEFSCDAFVNRGGRIPAPIHSFKKLVNQDIFEVTIFGVLDQHADIISSESDMVDMHTGRERMSGSSVKRTWERLHKIIEEFP